MSVAFAKATHIYVYCLSWYNFVGSGYDTRLYEPQDPYNVSCVAYPHRLISLHLLLLNLQQAVLCI